MKIILYDIDSEKIDIAKELVGDRCECIVADVRKMPLEKGDALVTAGNSFGIMDGGLDQVVECRFPFTQGVVQELIINRFYGELPIGCSCFVKQANGLWIIYTPTMQVPMQLVHSANCYYAALAAIRDASVPDKNIETLYMPLFGCGVGGMPVEKAVEQIVFAIDQVAVIKQASTDNPGLMLGWEYADRLHTRWHKMVDIAE